MERCNRLANGIIGLWMLITSLPLGAQELRWDRWTVEDGLSNNKVTAIQQDQFGWIWIADSLVANGLSAAPIRWALHMDESGTWGVNSQGDLVQLRAGTSNKGIKGGLGLAELDFHTTLLAKDGALWFSHKAGGLGRAYIAEPVAQKYQPPYDGGEPLQQVSAMLTDATGSLWFANPRGLFCQDTRDGKDSGGRYQYLLDRESENGFKPHEVFSHTGFH